MAYEEILLKNASEVTIGIKYTGKPKPILAVYDYELKTDDANPPLEHHKGDNRNSQDDIYHLPTPIQNNKNRYIVLQSELAALDSDADFEIQVQVQQDGIIEKDILLSGKVSVDDNSVSKLLMIKFL